MRSCTCDHVTGPVYTADQCRRCWKWHYDAAYRTAHGGGARQSLCQHLGGANGETACPSCRGSVRLKTFGCSVHGTCTLHKAAGGLACCAQCPSYSPVAPSRTIRRRNLLFHLYPLRDGNWRWHLEQWRPRLGRFNGKRVCAIAFDGRTEPPAFAERECRKAGFDEVLSIENDPSLREVKTFFPMLEAVANVNPDEATLYAQSKGVTRNRPKENGDVWMGGEWAEALYELYVDAWPQILALLGEYPVAGAFKKRGPVWWESASTWHYSGSWLWFRNRDLFFKDWRRIEKFWTGIESYPSLHFSIDEAASVLLDEGADKINLYNVENWRDVIDPALREFRARTPDIPLSILVEAAGRSTLARVLDSIWDAGYRQGDEVLLMIDPQSDVARDAETAWRRSGLAGPCVRLACLETLQSLARNPSTLFIGDNQAFQPGAFDRIRRELAERFCRIIDASSYIEEVSPQ